MQSRWTLARLLEVCTWLRLTTLGGLSQLLDRLGISLKRGRAYIRSPDQHYEHKLSRIELARLRAKYAPHRYVFLYLDEVTYYRQPSIAYAYEAKGRPQPLARWSYRSNTQFRVVAALNAVTGHVTYRQRSKITLRQLSAFYADIRAVYPDAERTPAACCSRQLAGTFPSRCLGTPRATGMALSIQRASELADKAIPKSHL